ncbi:hypothetical protein [Nitratidesulfovibrio sp. 1201_IL3209]|uniref:hypothetical protein n=1 Tax=Nitratidesulfovibrio sp. 1201_IL3209 TaxID=3084053 RepID=UPI002FD9AACD
MKITRILPAALALVAITAGAALAAQNVSTTAMGMQSCPGYTAMQGRHAGMTGAMGQMMQNGQHMTQHGGGHMMSGQMPGPTSGPATGQSRAPGMTSDAMPGMSAGR